MKNNQTNTATAKTIKPTINQLSGGLIISLNEARKIMGHESNDLSDDELLALIFQLSELAQTILNMPLSSVN